MASRSDFRAVTPEAPCPVCSRDHKCAIGDDGLICCGRSSGEIRGFSYYGQAEKDPQWSLYRRKNGSANSRAAGDARSHALNPPRRKQEVDWGRLTSEYKDEMSEDRAKQLADHLRVPVETLALLRVGFDEQESCWTMPECDASGAVVGICRRYEDGRKRQMKGGSRGIYIPVSLARSSGPIFVPEGFSCTAALIGMGLAAIGRSSNTGSVEELAKLLSSIPVDRPIVVLGENDGKPNGDWPGKEGAESTAELLAAAIGRPVWIAFPPGRAKDSRAWFISRDPDLDDPEILESIGREYVTAITENAREVVPWEAPTPLGAIDLPTFPTEALPPWVREFVDAQAIATQTPPDLGAMLTLAALAIACAGRMVVRVKPDYAEPLNIYTVTTQPPGSRKSAVFRQVVAPILEFERELAADSIFAIAAAASQRKIDERRLESLQKKAAAAEGAEGLEAAQQAEALARKIAGESIPSEPQLLADDSTPEALTSIMAANGGRMAVMSAEGGIFGMMAGRYHARQQTPNLDVWLKGHAGDRMRVDRNGRPPESIDHPVLTVGLAVQPDVIHGLAANPGFRGVGLLARFLYSMPESLVGRRKAETPSMPSEVAEMYRNRLRTLLRLPAGKDDMGSPRANTITLSPEADVVRIAFTDEIEPQMAELGLLDTIGDWASKLPGAVIRIAGLLHSADLAGERPPWEVEIPEGTIRRAIAIGRYLIPHALAAFAAMGTDPALADAAYLLTWIERQELKGVTKRHCFEGTRGRFRKVEALEPALRTLEEHGYLRRREERARRGAGRPPSPVYEVNPKIFAGRGTPIPDHELFQATESTPDAADDTRGVDREDHPRPSRVAKAATRSKIHGETRVRPPSAGKSTGRPGKEPGRKEFLI